MKKQIDVRFKDFVSLNEGQKNLRKLQRKNSFLLIVGILLVVFFSFLMERTFACAYGDNHISSASATTLTVPIILPTGVVDFIIIYLPE